MFPVSLGFSPCPNDTYIFAGLVNGFINQKLNTQIVVKDVEELNQQVAKTSIDISKLSFFSYFKNHKDYILLDSGSALGKKCGPLLIGNDSKIPKSAKVAIPGENTTANLLLMLADIGDFETVSMKFDQIIPSILDGTFDYGLIIHESRFTFEKAGLKLVFDFGDWWERTTSLPLPLGGIAAKRSLDKNLIKEVQTAIVKSIKFADQSYNKVEDYIQRFSQELEENVIRKHIELYVNSFSKSLTSEGRRAILKMFEMAISLGLLEKKNDELFFLG